MLEVAVIGAGASGLVAARQLIHAGLHPTIFETSNAIGGAWNSKGTGKMWNGLHTNLSNYTCRFSDFPWPDGSSTFPSVDEMHDYLEGYSDEFLTSSSCNFQLECKVFNVEQQSISTAIQNANYKVEWTDLTTKTSHSRDFGGVVVASGFFNTPKWPAFVTKNNKQPQLMHSSEYRTNNIFKDKKIAVVGSSFSGLEVSANIAKTASRVVNIIPSIPWVIPRWIPTIQPTLKTTDEYEEQKSSDENLTTSLTILPADLVLYQRTQPYPKVPETTSLTPDDCRKRHKYIQSLVGLKQHNSTLGEPLNMNEPPMVAINDEYLDLLREDKIEVVHGRLVGINDDGTLQIDASSGDNSTTSELNDIDHVLCCTGFMPQLNFLSTDILSSIDYDQDDCFSPMTLAWDTLHPSLPNLSFCGMYRGPYMGVMEMQARLAAGVMSGTITLEEEQIQYALKTSQSIRSSTPRAQFPHFDYPGFIDTLSTLCYQNGECPKYNTAVGDMIVPTFYQDNDELSQQCKVEIEDEVKKGQDGSRMPKLVLGSILGQWTYDRNIVHLQTRKVEHVYGTVKYSKYWDRSTDDDDDEDGPRDVNNIQYREDGVYELTPTQNFDVFREYEYGINNDALEIYFVEGGKRALLFLSLKFSPEDNISSSDDDGYWIKACSDHLCIRDLYSATFRVKLNGLSASEIIIKYRVVGPSKDYESTTILKPQSS